MANLQDLLESIVKNHVGQIVAETVAAYRGFIAQELGGSGAATRPARAPAKAAAPSAAPTKKGKKFSRRDPKQIAATVEKVLGFIKGHPGLNSEAIAKAVGGDGAGVSDALARLRAAKRVNTVGEKRAMKYQAADAKTAAPPVAKAAKPAPASTKKAKKKQKAAARMASAAQAVSASTDAGAEPKGE